MPLREDRKRIHFLFLLSQSRSNRSSDLKRNTGTVLKLQTINFLGKIPEPIPEKILLPTIQL